MIEKGDKLFRPEFFAYQVSKAMGAKVRTIKPVISFEKDQVKLGFNVGTRGNGKDAPFWPKDLTTEIVT